MEWLKRKIRRWLAEDAGPPAPVLEAIINGQIVRVIPVTAVGTGLMCRVPSKNKAMSQQIILEHSAADRDHFWDLWRHFGGRAVWEDGTEFEPEVK